MKIAFILPSLANKGPVLVCKDIVDNIINDVDECVVFYFDDVCEVCFPCKVYKIGFFHKLDFSRYDVVHSHMFRPDVFVWLRSFFRKDLYKTVSTIHTAIYDDLNFAYSKLKSTLLPPIWSSAWKSFDNVVVLTGFAKGYYSYLGTNINIIANGRAISKTAVNQDDIDLINGYKLKYKIIGTVVSYDNRKGLSQVINALKYLENYVFLVVGTGPETVKNELYELACELNVNDRVVFLGKRLEGDRYMKYFDIFIIPSISEGFPLALLEAAAHNTPIVCSDIPVFKEIFSEEEASFFNLFDIQSLVIAVNKCELNGDEQRKRAHRRYLEQYTPVIMGNNYLKLYKNMSIKKNVK